ncbi:MAG: D-2-hydroxyacid dehydrogenase [candidate division KSB1 bacterium]|nr:D-2-hydroxyacid dehydrogenase [candidate division KSB1 bacterium]
MNIVVMDGYTMNPGDLSWDALEDLGHCRIYARTPPELIIERAKDADIVFVNKSGLTRQDIEQLPRLKFIGVLATGYNVVNLEAARERNIPVTNIPAYSTESVVQMVFAHVLNLSVGLAHHAETVRQGRWSQSVDFCYYDTALTELYDRVLGIIGYGRIGQAVARVARAFGMQILVHSRTRPETLQDGVTWTDMDELFRQSDVVTLHCPLTEETEGLVNAEHLAAMKSTAYLINTSRGPVVDEQALADALNSGEIAGAGLDVLSEEPANPDNPLLQARNCTITPHIAWATQAARRRLLRIAADNVRHFLDGDLQNVVNGVTRINDQKGLK